METIEIHKVQNGYIIRGSSAGIRDGFYSSNVYIAKNLEEITNILRVEPFLVGYEPEEGTKIEIVEAERPD